MGKPTICLGKNKGADQLHINCETPCFRYSDSTVPLLLKSEISRFYLFSVTVQAFFVGPVRKPHCWFSHEVAQMPCAYHYTDMIVCVTSYTMVK